MTDIELPPPAKRPRPVLLYAALMAALAALSAGGYALGILPPAALAWITLASIVASAVGGVLVQGAVTPLSAPQDGRGRPLLPAATILNRVSDAAREGAADALRARPRL